MELNEFECCRQCKYINVCQKPCEKFLEDKRMDYLDSLCREHRTGIEKDIEAAKADKEFQSNTKDR